MDKKTKDLIDESVKEIIKRSATTKKLADLNKKHSQKLHFIPKQYRILGGILQSMNIQFGNFIETLMKNLIANEEKYEIIEQYSGKKSNRFTLSIESDSLIDAYITKCQKEYQKDDELSMAFNNLLNQIYENSQNESFEKINFTHDIDLLFKDKNTNKYYYLEIKFNDDHDSGKFVDINRKFIKTYGYLLNELPLNHNGQLIPLLFFFNNKLMKGNIFLPEETNIRRGEKFFNEFLSIDYDDLREYLENFSQREETLKEFEHLYHQIMTMELE